MAAIELERHFNNPRLQHSASLSFHTCSLNFIDGSVSGEVITWHGLMTYYVLFFLHLDSRRASMAGILPISPMRNG